MPSERINTARTQSYFDLEIDNPRSFSPHRLVHSHLVARDSPDKPNFPVYTSNTEVQELEKYAPVSASDFELVQKVEEFGFVSAAYNVDKFLPSEPEAQASLKGISGHQINSLATSLVRNIRTKRPLYPLVTEQTSLKPHEKECIETIASDTLSRYQYLSIKDVSEVIKDIWQELRQQYVFVKLIPNSSKKPLIDGAKFHQGWTQAVWNSRGQIQFEADVLETYQRQIDNYLNVNLFDDTTEESLLPIETDPQYQLAIEQPTIAHIWFGSHKIQFKGQIDYVLSNSVDRTKYYVLIDNKFGSPSGLRSMLNRVQVLNYCHGIASGDFSKTDIDWVRPENVLFFYQIVDTARKQTRYEEVTITPQEYREVMDECTRLTNLWYENYNLLRTIRKLRAEAMVTPHLPHPEELTRPSQRKLFLI